MVRMSVDSMACCLVCPQDAQRVSQLDAAKVQLMGPCLDERRVFLLVNRKVLGKEYYLEKLSQQLFLLVVMMVFRSVAPMACP